MTVERNPERDVNLNIERTHQCPECKAITDGVMRVILVSPCCIRPLGYKTLVFVDRTTRKLIELPQDAAQFPVTSEAERQRLNAQDESLLRLLEERGL